MRQNNFKTVTENPDKYNDDDDDDDDDGDNDNDTIAAPNSISPPPAAGGEDAVAVFSCSIKGHKNEYP